MKMNLIVSRSLNNDEQVLFVRGHHDLVFFRPQAQKREVVRRVHLLEHGFGLIHQLIEKSRVLRRQVVVQSRLNGNAVVVHHQRSQNAFKKEGKNCFAVRCSIALLSSPR